MFKHASRFPVFGLLTTESGLPCTSGSNPIVSRLLPGRANRLPAVCVPVAQEHYSHLARRDSCQHDSHLCHGVYADPHPQLLGLQQRGRGTTLLAHQCCRLSGVFEVADWWLEASFLGGDSSRLYPLYNAFFF